MSEYVYVFGHSDAELERLAFQSEILEPITKRMLVAANVRPGSRVLDIGCGIGSVTQQVASLVGSSGHVIGIDQCEKAIGTANSLSCKQGIENIEFRHCSLEQASFSQNFDVVVGRAVLLFQSDVTSFLKTAARWVKPGGYLAFHEIDDGRQFQSKPKVELWDRVVQELLSRLQSGCPQYDIAQRMIEAFNLAGLPIPEMTYEIPVSGGTATSLCIWATETLRSLSNGAPTICLPDGQIIDFDSLNQQLQKAISTANAQVEFLGQACAWAQIPSP